MSVNFVLHSDNTDIGGGLEEEDTAPFKPKTE